MMVKLRLILIMPSLQEIKAKFNSFIEYFHKKEAITAIGVTAFMGASLLLLRYLQHSRSPATQHIHLIYQNIIKSLELSEKSRQPLIIEQQHTLQRNGITMIYTLASMLRKKQINNEQSIRNPFLPPFEEGIFIQQLSSTHRLLFNKFNIYQQHLLVVTKQFEPQSSPLTKQDLKQCVYVYKAINGLYYFNSGAKAGASQIHKHLQIFPNEAKDLPIFRSILEFARQIKHQESQQKHLNPQQFSIIQYPPFNFCHGLIIIGSNQANSSSNQDKAKQDSKRSDIKMQALIANTYKAYQRLYKHFIINHEGQETPDYNLFGCQHFLMLIPRKKQKAFSQISINSVAFMGSILFKDKNLLRKYINENRQGYQILEDITFSKSKRN